MFKSYTIHTQSNLTLLITTQMKKALRETQTLRAGCSNAQPKIFTPPQTPFPEVQDDGQI